MSEQEHKMMPLEEYSILASQLICIITFLISSVINIKNVIKWEFDNNSLLLTAGSLIIFSFLSLYKFFWLNWNSPR